MRIAIFSDVYKPQINGVVNHVALLKRFLEEWGHEVYLFVPGTREQEDSEPNVIRLSGLPIAHTGYHLSVHLDRPSRERLAGMDIVHVHQPFISGSFGLYCVRQYGLPLIFTNHTRYDLYVQAYLPFLPPAISESALQTFFRRFSRRCAAVIAPSPSIAQVMKRWQVDGRIEIIPNGIELARFQAADPIARGRFGIDAEAVVAIYVGRISPEKSLDRLLRCLARIAPQVPLAHLVLVGNGSELPSLRRLVQRLGIAQRVTFTGEVAYTEVPGYLALADLFVTASMTEVHPLTLIEAAAAGLPAVGIRSSGVVDIIRDGTTGLIAPDRDEAFEAALLRLLQDADLRRQMGAQAQATSCEYAAETNARRIETLYREFAAANTQGKVPATTGK